MELQINILETRIEKMQERFNKYLEEIKKSQYVMNNAIKEIKNTLEFIFQCLILEVQINEEEIGKLPEKESE